MLKVLGIDPGLAKTGYGIIEFDQYRFRYICHGVIQTDSGLDLSIRLKAIFNQIQSVITQYRPEEAGIEGIYFARNAISAIPVAHAKGVIHLLFAINDIIAGEYSPLQIKQSIVGNGRADKRQVQEMVKLLLNLDSIPEPDHGADALAAAICHCNNRSLIND